jgi:hypothetical protein
MRNRIRIVAAVMEFLAAFVAAFPAAGQTSDGRRPTATYSVSMYYWCRSDRDVNGKFYFSQVAVAAPGISDSDLQQSFQVFLVSKYGYPRSNSASCGLGNQSDVILGRKMTVDNLRNSKYTVEDVDFTYSPVSSAPAAAPPPSPAPAASTAPAAPRAAVPVAATPKPPAARPAAPPRPAPARPAVAQSRYILCYGNPSGNGKDTYYNEPVEVSKWDPASVQDYRMAFGKALRERYKLMFNVRCVTPKNLDDVNKSKQIMSAHHNLIATGWKQ